jgi:hypothetical protein
MLTVRVNLAWSPSATRRQPSRGIKNWFEVKHIVDN